MIRVEATIAYADADPERVFTMLADPQFQRLKCAATGATNYDVEITQPGANTVIRCRRILPLDDLPDFVRPFAAGGLELIETIDWSPVDAEGARIGAVTLAFTKQPVSMKGQLRMVAAGTGTTAGLVADLVANVPFFGARIENACEPVVQKALRTEESLGEKWLAEHR